jgi:flagellar protein FlaJ
MAGVLSAILPSRKRKAAGTRSEVANKASRINVSERELFFDLFTQISYMAALATARVSRAEMFGRAARLKLATTEYFLEIYTLANRLGLDYAEACRVVGERVKNHDVSELLLRMAGSLNAGEEEGEFLTREARTMADRYETQYEADIESLKKWTDAYVALAVSAVLIVVVTIVSTMIYALGRSSMILVVFAVVVVTGFGAWVIYASSPRESFTRASGLSSSLQLRAWSWFKISAPLGLAVGSLLYLSGFGLAWVLIAGGAGLMPPGFIMNLDARRVSKKDQDLSTAMRLLGGVTGATGGTVVEALSRIEKRSMASLGPELRRLQTRLEARLDQDRCWARLVAEAGSEMIERSVIIFWHALRLGGDAALVGSNAAYFAARVSTLRSKRALVAGTFKFLIVPLHVAIIGLLIFIINVMSMFGRILVNSGAEETGDSAAVSSAQTAATAGLSAFGALDFEFLNMLVLITVMVITAANAAAIGFVAGGHWVRSAFNFGLLILLSGILMVVVPSAAEGVFRQITAVPG